MLALRLERAAGNARAEDRATDVLGNVQHEATPWNALGYLYGGVVGHPVEVS